MTILRAKTRATTLEAKLGFQDNQLGEDAHDQIILQIDKYLPRIIRHLRGSQWNKGDVWIYEQGMRYRQRANSEARWLDVLNTFLATRPIVPAFPDYQVEKKVWEYPITTSREYVVGFVDLYVVYRSPELWLENGQFVMKWQEKQELFFEAKTVLGSAGELLRQIRLYQVHRPGMYVIVAPDDRYRTLLEEQSIRFINSAELPDEEAEARGVEI